MCCGGKVIKKAKSICCGGKEKPTKEGRRCCPRSGKFYNPENEFCCGMDVREKNPNRPAEMCCGGEIFDPTFKDHPLGIRHCCKIKNRKYFRRKKFFDKKIVD